MTYIYNNYKTIFIIYLIGVFMKYDYLIVGSGLFGSVFAYEMTKRGKKCLVIEKRDHIGGNVYTELEFACEESGDLSQPLEAGLLTMDRVKLMNNLLEEGTDPDELAKKTTYFKSVGMGLFDLCIANKLMKDAGEKGIGQTIKA